MTRGCDSTTNITICDNQLPYNWRGVDYNAAGSYSVIGTSIAGCDSTATLNLTVNPVLFDTTNVTICDNQLPYNWRGVDYNAAGSYSITGTSVAGCDSTATLNLTVNSVLYDTTNVTICDNQLPYNWRGVDYNAAGSYTVNGTSIAGCDSIATLNLTVNPVLFDTTNITICDNQLPYNWRGVDYNAAGSYSVIGTSIAGCDSTATLNLTVNPVLFDTTNVTICDNQLPYNWRGVDYNAAGSYSITGTSVAGCDSTATLNLTVNSVLYDTTNVTICDNQLPYNWRGVDYNAAGSYTVNGTSIAGCDSIATLNLTVNPVLFDTTNITICDNQLPYNWRGVDYNAAGSYSVVGTSIAGCDSTATLNLTVNPVLYDTTNVTICDNQLPYNWRGNDYNAAGSYSVVGTSVAGCDSTATLNLNVNAVLYDTTNVTICDNQLPYNWRGVDYNAAGSYTVNGTSIAGCDSIATLNLTVNPVLYDTTNVTICDNQLPYNWRGVDYNAAGSYSVVGTSIAGCDSTATLNLTVNPVLYDTTNVTICDNQLPYNWRGVDYNAAGSYSVVGTSVAGCDSTATLNLNVNTVLYDTTNVTICDNQLPYNWRGVDYNAAGSYTVNGTSIAGCDSIATLNLTVNPVLYDTTNITICDNQLPYNWRGVDYNAAGSYSVIGTSIAGCDSTATLNLTVNPVLFDTTNVTICDNQLPYNWRGVDYNAAGSYSITGTSVAGCDSTATLNLTVNSVLYDTTNVTICDNQLPYNWRGVDYNAAGSYTVNGTSIAGCDSIATLNLTVNPVLFDTTNITICDNQLPYNWRGVDYNAAGSYSVIGTSIAGCDSTATLNLTVNPVLFDTTNVTICDNQLPYNWRGVDYNAAGSYSITGTSVAGCDSTATLNLTVNSVLYDTTNVTICDNQLPYNWRGVDYNAAGSYTVNGTSIAGCDSIATLNLTVNPVLFDTTNITICDNQLPYNWRGVDYNAAGSYSVVGTSIAGCDSTATLNLTVNPVLYDTTNVTICDNQLPYNWRGNDYNAAGSYSVVGTSVAGCDSTATLNLTVNSVLYDTTNVTICDNQLPYNWRGVDYNAAGSYTVNGTSIAGCDSIATLNLTVNPVLYDTTNVTICDNQLPYNWRGVDYNAAGSYSVVGTSIAGCDSTATLNLTVNPVLYDTTNVTICDNQLPYNWRGVDYNAAGSYSVVGTSVAGCDSTATLNLNVNTVLYDTTNVTICDNQLPYNWRGVDYNAAGSYTVNGTSIAGCDSIATLNLTVNPVLYDTTNITICDNQLPYNWRGVDYNAAGSYSVVGTSIAGLTMERCGL